MTLRTRLIIAFVVLGALPLMAVGWITNQRNLKAVEDLVTRETQLVAQRVAREMGERHDARMAEILFLAENEETLALFGRSTMPAFALDSGGPEGFLRGAWGSMERGYRWGRLEDTTGALVLELGERESGISSGSGVFPLSALIRDPQDGGVLGRVMAEVAPSVIIPGNMAERGFGEEGYVAVVDRASDRVLYRPENAFGSWSAEQAFPGWSELPANADAFRYSSTDEEWIASLAPVSGTTWTVLSAAPLEGFVLPFRDAARANLVFVLTITLLASAVFLFSTLRTTRSLVELTGAAERVARGDLHPKLPPPGNDEAGTLSRTFALMLERVRDMIRQVESSRQMAAVGEFSSQIAHELRNPLTAIRMSLQGLHRKLQDSEHARPLEIALQETERLDRVAGGVLSLARAPSGERIWVSAGTLVKGAVESVGAELERLDVRVSLDPGDHSVRLFVHEEALRGALINLLRNAADAMPQGGEVRIAFTIPHPGTVEIHVRDQGPGVSPDLVERIFDPFVTSKAKGNGFGLPLAVRAAEANGGSIRLSPPEAGVGAHFVLSVPLREKAEEQP